MEIPAQESQNNIEKEKTIQTPEVIQDLQLSQDHTDKPKKPSVFTYLAGTLLILAIPVWVWLLTPQLTRLPDDFSYSANVFSLDNFYDEEKGQFSGEARSVTKFSYEVTDKKDGNLIVKNIFDVRTVTGDPIFAVERLYGIDPKTGQHAAGFGDKNREGYLFAPKGLKKGEPFTYWHINYDGPAHLTFAGEENINGLKVYRYESRYKEVEIDQTKNLGFLPGVGVTRGVNLDPYLQLWIEPVTGRLVKYKDETTAYYYDLQTHKRLNPWNKFSNTYQRSTITKQVEIAKAQKLFFRFLYEVIPLLLALAALTVILIGVGKKKPAIIVAAIGVIGLGGYFVMPSLVPLPEEKIKIGISRWVPMGNKAYDQNIQGFKDALSQAGYSEGKNVQYYLETADADKERQKEIAKGYLARNVDLIYSLTTPGSLIIKEEVADRPIVFSIVTYPVESSLIKSVKNSGNNLVGVRNWVPIKDQLNVFAEIVPSAKTIGFVHRAGESNSTIQFQEMKEAASESGVLVIEIAGKNLQELTQALQNAPDSIDALYSSCDTLVQGEAEETIIAYAHTKRLPSFSCNSTGPLKGDLIGTVSDFYEIGKLAGDKAVLILEGASPSSLETGTVARQFIYVNQKTADLLGITIPQAILIKAKEIIR